MKLSIVFPCHNDSEIYNSIESARATAGSEVEIVVVDDCSAVPVRQLNDAKIIRTQRRVGVGPARTLGAIHAKEEFLLLTDSHVRFTPGWYEAAMNRITQQEARNVLHCAMCLGLDENNMDVNNPVGRYYGATWNFSGPDANAKGKQQVFECVWGKPVADNSDLPACMGASYFVHRRFFLTLMPLRFLRSWGGDEQALSLKYWLAGDGIRFMENVKIGHKFRTLKNRVPFQIQNWETIYNKLFIIWTCLPEDLALVLQKRFPNGGDTLKAVQQLHSDWRLVEYERARNKMLFDDAGLSFEDYLTKFGLAFPGR